MSFELSCYSKNMEESAPVYPARRGDLLVLVTERLTSYQGQSSEVGLQVQVGVITSITRKGMATAWATPHHAKETEPPSRRLRLSPRQSTKVVPQSKIDVPATLDAVREHTWKPGGAVKPFDSIEQVKAFLQPFRRSTVQGPT